MRKYLFVLLLSVFSLTAQAIMLRESVAVYKDASLIVVPRQVRNVAWVAPSRATTVNGLSLGWLVLDDTTFDRTQHINGVYVNVSPLTMLWCVMAFGYMPFTVYHSVKGEGSEHFQDLSFAKDLAYTFPESSKRLNGLSISIADAMDSYTVNGIQISGILNTMNITNGITVNGGMLTTNRLNGLSVSGLMASIHTVNGVSITAVFNNSHTLRGMQIGAINHSYCVTGLQIGLWNKTHKLRGLQLGVWNKSKKRSLPFLNFGW